MQYRLAYFVTASVLSVTVEIYVSFKNFAVPRIRDSLASQCRLLINYSTLKGEIKSLQMRDAG